MRGSWRKLNLSAMAETAGHFATMAWATDDGDVPVIRALQSVFVWRDYDTEEHPSNVSRWKHKWGDDTTET